MKKIALLFLIFHLSFYAQTIGLTQHSTGTLDSGYVLFAPTGSTSTYLIDKCGNQINSWPSNYRPGQSCYILPDGTLLRTGNTNNTTFTAGGKGGVIQKLDWNGVVTWSYTISDATQCQHHDVKALANGNVLVIAWESKTNTQAVAKGRNPFLVGTTIWSEQIIEIEPTGTSGGNIVWEWHLFDHLIQDYDATKSNYGVINNNPQLININYKAGPAQDWIHLNSIDYNPTLDQIVVSSHEFNEIWIIDHSTTSAEAASHSGGNSGKGGDVLYRWGNPQAYNNGTVANQKFFGQHNARWIESGFSFENQIMVFNNGLGRTGGNYSTVEVINPPEDGYTYTATLPYLPEALSWIYNDGNPNSMYAQNISGAQPLSNGNVLFCNGPSGTFTEINSEGTTLWNYVSPSTNMGVILNQNATPTNNPVFRCSFYPSNYVGFLGQPLTAGNTIENTNSISASCVLAIDGFELTNELKIYPNPAHDFTTLYIENEFGLNSKIELINSLGQTIKEIQITASENTIALENYATGIYFIKVSNDKQTKTLKLIISK
ncbi:aryl-sulfate sulfotransferase [uncultured Flavobacterium sp.]|uniref:aryl-sulfate sulfotransferase n=1 Tax=uncultured Flavobacterium sp. TaxID=165435 RepID=UPI0030CA2B0E